MLALVVASCDKNPGAGGAGAANPGPGTTGERVWAKIDENLDDAEAVRVLTKENFGKIRQGMTLQEVVGILGVKTPSKKPVDEGCWINWQGGGKKIGVHLNHGKVSRTHQEGVE